MESYSCATCGFAFRVGEDEYYDAEGRVLNNAGFCHWCAAEGRETPLCGDHCYYANPVDRDLPLSCCGSCRAVLACDTGYAVRDDCRDPTYA